MKRTEAQWWFTILGRIERMVREDGAYPNAGGIARKLGLSRRYVMRMLTAMKADGLVALLGTGPAQGWTLTAEGARWRGVAVPVIRVDGPNWWVRARRGRLRAYRVRERLRAARSAHAVFESESGESVFEA